MSEKIDLTPAILDLVLYAGDGTYLQFNFVREDTTLIDVSGLVWKAQIRKKRTDEIAAEIEIDTDNAPGGSIILHIPSETTRILAKSSQWDLQVSPSVDAEPVTVLQGSVVCNLDVTRAEVTP